MENQPLVSVIIPAYNAEKWVCDCVRSVFEQTYPNWECIVVDDGSQDSTALSVQRLQTLHERKLSLILKENGGAASARNAGLKVAKGEYVVFADADDLLHPLELEYAVRAQQQDRNAMVIWNCGAMPLENPEFSPQTLTPHEMMITFQFKGSLVSPINKLYSREVLEEMPLWFDEEKFRGGLVGEDKDFVDRYMEQHQKRQGACYVYLDTTLYKTRAVNENSLCASFVREHPDMLDAKKEDEPAPGYCARKLKEIQQNVLESEKFYEDARFQADTARHYLNILAFGVYSAHSLGEALPKGFWKSDALNTLLKACRSQKAEPLYYLLFCMRAVPIISTAYCWKRRRDIRFYRLEWLAQHLLPGWK